MVKTASRAVRAISFGVFCRLCAFHQGNHPLDESLSRTCGYPYYQPNPIEHVCRRSQHPVTADSWITGALSPVTALSRPTRTLQLLHRPPE